MNVDTHLPTELSTLYDIESLQHSELGEAQKIILDYITQLVSQRGMALNADIPALVAQGKVLSETFLVYADRTRADNIDCGANAVAEHAYWRDFFKNAQFPDEARTSLIDRMQELVEARSIVLTMLALDQLANATLLQQIKEGKFDASQSGFVSSLGDIKERFFSDELIGKLRKAFPLLQQQAEYFIDQHKYYVEKAGEILNGLPEHLQNEKYATEILTGSKSGENGAQWLQAIYNFPEKLNEFKIALDSNNKDDLPKLMQDIMDLLTMAEGVIEMQNRLFTFSQLRKIEKKS